MLRRFFQVERGAVQPLSIVTELSESAVAVEAQDTANAGSRTIVIDVFGNRLAADRADTALVADHLVDFVSANPRSTLQVIMTIASVKPIFGFTSTSVVARLAVGMSTVSHPLVTRELFEGLILPAVKTALHAQIVRTRYDINDSRT
jgi:hypothetical protein